MTTDTHQFNDEAIEFTETQKRVRDEIQSLCAEFGREYWRQKDAAGEYPHDFVDRLGDRGWLGILVPEKYGGKGLGTAEAVVMMETIAASGAGFSAAQTIHAAIYNSAPLVNHGSEDMKEDLLPRVANGDAWIQCFGLTEPDAGSESTAISTRAERDRDEYVVNGEKIWTSRLDVSDYMVLAVRTTPKSEVSKKTQGVSLLLVDINEGFEQNQIEVEEIEKTVSNVVSSFRVQFDDLRVPTKNLIGEEDDGFYHVLDGLNEERLVIAAECIGLGEAAIERGVEYANDRVVFDRPIGKNQAVQHPLAAAYARVQAAKQLVYNAAGRQMDEPKTVGAWANMGKYLAAEACFDAADAAVQVHGGLGVARERDVERYFREARLTRLVPITQELALNYISENVLGLPRSFA